MPPEIKPKQIPPDVQRRTADLLRQKVAQRGPERGEIAAAEFTVEDAIDRLQLALACSEIDRPLALLAVNQVNGWVRWLVYGNSAYANMLEIFPRGHRREEAERKISIVTHELRMCALALDVGREFRLDAITVLRTTSDELSVMSTALRQRDRRRQALRALARMEFGSMNRAQALVNTVAGAIRIVRDSIGTSIERNIRIDYLVMLDLFAVIIGRDMLSGRLEGDYFAGLFNGSGGFKPELQDRHYQAQHALAGIWMGYNYFLAGQWAAMALERLGKEPQDVECYRVTSPLGRSLNRDNLQRLPAALARAIGDATVVPPP